MGFRAKAHIFGHGLVKDFKRCTNLMSGVGEGRVFELLQNVLSKVLLSSEHDSTIFEQLGAWPILFGRPERLECVAPTMHTFENKYDPR